MATKSQLRDAMLDAGITTVVVISYPDWNGGREHDVKFNTQSEKIKREAFEYIEFEGDVTKALRHRNDIFVDHFEPRYETPVDIEMLLEDLILRGIKTYKEKVELYGGKWPL